ncbi:MAG: hypothetical protein M0R06_03400 [Sphaerochaeta sp.]|nr:hypothetical protein [Sphaerochaeta sp.]
MRAVRRPRRPARGAHGGGDSGARGAGRPAAAHGQEAEARDDPMERGAGRLTYAPHLREVPPEPRQVWAQRPHRQRRREAEDVLLGEVLRGGALRREEKTKL